MPLFLAVDAGGTKTDLLLADQTRDLARVRTGSIKRLQIDEATVQHHLERGLAELSAKAGISLSSVDVTCIGTAGESIPMVADWLSAAFPPRVGGSLLLLGDVEIALDAAFPGEPGVLVLAGTGSNVAGRAEDGRITTAGGWGPVLSDQGSGHRIGTEALRALFLAIDEQRATLLLDAILKQWHLSSVTDLVSHANAVPAPIFSQLAATVLACAQQGDPIAVSVLRREGQALAHLASLVIRRLQIATERTQYLPPVAFAGSILAEIAPLREAVVDTLRQEYPGIVTLSGTVDPLQGALWRARTALRTSARQA